MVMKARRTTYLCPRNLPRGLELLPSDNDSDLPERPRGKTVVDELEALKLQKHIPEESNSIVGC